MIEVSLHGRGPRGRPKGLVVHGRPLTSGYCLGYVSIVVHPDVNHDFAFVLDSVIRSWKGTKHTTSFHVGVRSAFGLADLGIALGRGKGRSC